MWERPLTFYSDQKLHLELCALKEESGSWLLVPEPVVAWLRLKPPVPGLIAFSLSKPLSSVSYQEAWNNINIILI